MTRIDLRDRRFPLIRACFQSLKARRIRVPMNTQKVGG
jgi:hypothetical protein